MVEFHPDFATLAGFHCERRGRKRRVASRHPLILGDELIVDWFQPRVSNDRAAVEINGTVAGVLELMGDRVETSTRERESIDIGTSNDARSAVVAERTLADRVA